MERLGGRSVFFLGRLPVETSRGDRFPRGENSRTRFTRKFDVPSELGRPHVVPASTDPGTCSQPRTASGSSPVVRSGTPQIANWAEEDDNRISEIFPF